MSKVAVITGATGGLGSGTARAFLDKGWSVALLARNSEKLKNLSEQLDAERNDTFMKPEELGQFLCELASMPANLVPNEVVVTPLTEQGYP